MNTRLTGEALDKLLQKINEGAGFYIQHGKRPGAITMANLLMQASFAVQELREYRKAENEHLSLRDLVFSEIGDFFAGFGSPGEPETPEEMQRQLTMRVGRIINNHICNKSRADALAGILQECRIARDEAQLKAQGCESLKADNDRLRGLLRGFIEEAHQIADERDCHFGVRALDWLRQEIKIMREMENELARRDAAERQANRNG